MNGYRRLSVVTVALTVGVCAGCAPEGDTDGFAGMPQPTAGRDESSEAGASSLDPAGSAADGAVLDHLAGTSWRLIKIMSMDDSVYTPDDPALYTLYFGTDGTVRLRADCNRGTGSWASSSPGQLTFGPIATTRAACPPGSLHDRYVSQFEWVRSYVMEDGRLFLATMADGSIIEFEPVDDVPLAATVLGEEVRTTDASEMQRTVLARLLRQYAAERGIAASASEIEAWIEALEGVKARDRETRQARLADIGRQLEAGDLSQTERAALEAERGRLTQLAESLDREQALTAEEAAEVDAMQRDMARAVIEHWEINQELYREYGGRVIFQQAGPEPIDAYRLYLEQRQQEGAFTIHNAAFETEFWRYFTDDSIHTFMEPGSEAEARAFRVPPWEQLESAE
jgi:heat shock protein HslJ